MKKYKGIICLDSDVKHKLDDVIKLEEMLSKNNNFVLVTRLFNISSTPIRNKIGNKTTSLLFNYYIKYI